MGPTLIRFEREVKRVAKEERDSKIQEEHDNYLRSTLARIPRWDASYGGSSLFPFGQVE